MSQGRVMAAPAGWHMVARAEEIPPGTVLPVDDFPRSILLVRTASGQLRATARHCPHLGANLAGASVEGDNLVCPLHAWKFDVAGRCVDSADYAEANRRRSLRVYPLVERYGAVFVSSDPRPTYTPEFQTASEDQLYFRGGGSLDVDCAWHVIACNGYDLHHFGTIHRRGFHSPPLCEAISPGQFRLRLHASVSGTTARDRRIRKLSKDSIHIVIVNHGGTLLTVETDLGFVKTYLVLSLTPLGEGRTRVRYTLGIPRSSSALVDRVKHAVAFRHASRFLHDDVVSLAGTHFDPRMLAPEDDHLRHFFSWLASLTPSAPVSLPALDSAGFRGEGASAPDGLTSP